MKGVAIKSAMFAIISSMSSTTLIVRSTSTLEIIWARKLGPRTIVGGNRKRDGITNVKIKSFPFLLNNSSKDTIYLGKRIKK